MPLSSHNDSEISADNLRHELSSDGRADGWMKAHLALVETAPHVFFRSLWIHWGILWQIVGTI